MRWGGEVLLEEQLSTRVGVHACGMDGRHKANKKFPARKYKDMLCFNMKHNGKFGIFIIC
jgi:hypothetical protein